MSLLSTATKAVLVVLFFSIVMGLIALLPDYQMPSVIATGFQMIIDTAYWSNRYLPADTAIQVFGAYLLTEFVIWVWRNAQRIISILSRLFS